MQVVCERSKEMTSQNRRHLARMGSSWISLSQVLQPLTERISAKLFVCDSQTADKLVERLVDCSHFDVKFANIQQTTDCYSKKLHHTVHESSISRIKVCKFSPCNCPKNALDFGCQFI